MVKIPMQLRVLMELCEKSLIARKEERELPQEGE